MARPADPQRDDAIALIRRLVGEHGAKEGARLARAQFPDVPAASWGRWRQMAVGNVSEANVKASADFADEVRAAIPAPDQLAPAMLDPVPATRRALDFWRMLDELEHDAQMLREFALTKGLDGKIKVKAPFALRDAHRMRCDLIRLALQQAEVAHGVERAATFFQAVVDAVGEESPDCQRRIMARLHHVQGEAAARGF